MMGEEETSIPVESEETILQGPVEPDELAVFETDEERRIAAKLLPLIAAKANRLAEANKAKELEAFLAQLMVENKTIIDNKIEEFRKAMTPPTASELQQLLDKEYLSYSVKLRSRPNGTEREFTIQELPMATEAKVAKVIQSTLITRLKEINSVEWTATMTMAERIESIMRMIPGAVDTLSDCLAVCLDPWSEHPEITGQWVRDNISSTRMLAIIHAQVEVSRMRDFLSLASRFSPTMTI